ncbi:unnamed protein product [Trichogramma brassicae]|uniref:MATH domain-containing protein n=1 Tax=Trichogramma brassicae TaxID=86971 RepID=A0A6H5I9Z7_9HYME|nr:unnamed protein product [Trichogramma brassicae]
MTRGLADWPEWARARPRWLRTRVRLRRAIVRLSTLPAAAASQRVRLPSGVFATGQSKPNKLETNYFTFGGFDWNLVVYPSGNKEASSDSSRVALGSSAEGSSSSSSDRSGSSNRLSVHLVRLTGFDHQCRVRYIVSLGDGDRCIESGPIEDLSDVQGRGYGWQPRCRWSDVAHKGVLRLTLEMLEARTISEVLVQALGSASLPAAPCYDKDKQAWAIRADLHSDTVRLHLVYKDIHNVPRNHLRYLLLL